MRIFVLFCVVLAGCAAPKSEPAPANATAPERPPIGVAGGEPPAPVVPAGVLAHDANDFTFELIHKAAPASGNFLVSGFVARHAIGTLAAASPSRDAALASLHYVPSVAQPGYAEELAWATAARRLPFTSGARVFYESSRPLSDAFTKEAADRFGQSFEAVDFQANPTGARHRIGEWVAQKTGGQLTGDASTNAVPDGTTLAIGTAFGLEAQWRRPFETSATRDAPFTLATRAKRMVKMMGQTTTAAFAQMGDGTKVLDLALGPDADDLDGLSVLFVLPPSGTKLRTLESRLDRGLYDSWQAKLEVQNVDIEIPRISVQKEFDLTSLARAPDRSPVFANGESPRVRFVQGTVLKLDEVGVKAAAASIGNLTTATRKKPPPIPAFVANRPFLVFVHDHSTPIAPILLFCRVETPTE